MAEQILPHEEKQLAALEQASDPISSNKMDPAVREQVERALRSLESLQDSESRKLCAHLGHWLRRHR